MTFYEFESREIIDENFYAKLTVEPVGESYKYTLKFEDENGSVKLDGITSTPAFALLKLKNLLLATIDTLADCVEITKSASSQNAYFENAPDDFLEQEGWEESDEDDEII